MSSLRLDSDRRRSATVPALSDVSVFVNMHCGDAHSLHLLCLSS